MISASWLLSASAAQGASPVAVQDTAGKVAYVPRAGGPPDTAKYMWGGYAITLLVYGGYIVLLLRRMARVRRS